MVEFREPEALRGRSAGRRTPLNAEPLDCMGMPEERREFRTARWVVFFLGGVFSGCLFGAVCLLLSDGPSATALMLAGLAALFAAGLAESATARVELGPDRIEIVSNFRRIVVLRSDLVRAVAEKGVPIAIERASGGWIKLPEAVAGPHINTLRAWLRRTAASASRDGEES